MIYFVKPCIFFNKSLRQYFFKFHYLCYSQSCCLVLFICLAEMIKRLDESSKSSQLLVVKCKFKLHLFLVCMQHKLARIDNLIDKFSFKDNSYFNLEHKDSPQCHLIHLVLSMSTICHFIEEFTLQEMISYSKVIILYLRFILRDNFYYWKTTIIFEI